ncbi:hypothetical protein FQZ97_808150 [compost metagenome]
MQFQTIGRMHQCRGGEAWPVKGDCRRVGAARFDAQLSRGVGGVCAGIQSGDHAASKGGVAFHVQAGGGDPDTDPVRVGRFAEPHEDHGEGTRPAVCADHCLLRAAVVVAQAAHPAAGISVSLIDGVVERFDRSTERQLARYIQRPANAGVAGYCRGSQQRSTRQATGDGLLGVGDVLEQRSGHRRPAGGIFRDRRDGLPGIPKADLGTHHCAHTQDEWRTLAVDLQFGAAIGGICDVPENAYLVDGARAESEAADARHAALAVGLRGNDFDEVVLAALVVVDQELAIRTTACRGGDGYPASSGNTQTALSLKKRVAVVMGVAVIGNDYGNRHVPGKIGGRRTRNATGQGDRARKPELVTDPRAVHTHAIGLLAIPAHQRRILHRPCLRRIHIIDSSLVRSQPRGGVKNDVLAAVPLPMQDIRPAALVDAFGRRNRDTGLAGD